jgi:hypothetical protein
MMIAAAVTIRPVLEPVGDRLRSVAPLVPRLAYAVAEDLRPSSVRRGARTGRSGSNPRSTVRSGQAEQARAEAHRKNDEHAVAGRDREQVQGTAFSGSAANGTRVEEQMVAPAPLTNHGKVE